MRALVDTSVFVALETGRAIDRSALPADADTFVSVITVGELHAGVLAAQDVDTRVRRLRTLNGLAAMEVVPVVEPVAAEWARLRVYLAEQGRRVNVNDLWIAATAAALEIPLVTQGGDFDPLDGARGLTILRV